MREGKYPLIFIIEDNPLFLTMIEEHLSLNNLNNFKSFQTGDECIDQLHLHPDIVIMDYELGDTDGIQLLNTIKNRIDNIYVIMLTTSEDIGIALKALQGGAYDYVHKDELSFKLLKYIIAKIIADNKSGIFNASNIEMTGFKRLLRI